MSLYELLEANAKLSMSSGTYTYFRISNISSSTRPENEAIYCSATLVLGYSERKSLTERWLISQLYLRSLNSESYRLFYYEPPAQLSRSASGVMAV